jgi:hypothetical protein
MTDAIAAALAEVLDRLPEDDRRRAIELTSYHEPSTVDLARYQRINEAARLMLAVILQTTPRCADQSAAVRLVREARMTANAAIACDGLA